MRQSITNPGSQNLTIGICGKRPIPAVGQWLKMPRRGPSEPPFAASAKSRSSGTHSLRINRPPPLSANGCFERFASPTHSAGRGGDVRRAYELQNSKAQFETGEKPTFEQRDLVFLLWMAQNQLLNLLSFPRRSTFLGYLANTECCLALHPKT